MLEWFFIFFLSLFCSRLNAYLWTVLHCHRVLSKNFSHLHIKHLLYAFNAPYLSFHQSEMNDAFINNVHVCLLINQLKIPVFLLLQTDFFVWYGLVNRIIKSLWESFFYVLRLFLNEVFAKKRHTLPTLNLVRWISELQLTCSTHSHIMNLYIM